MIVGRDGKHGLSLTFVRVSGEELATDSLDVRARDAAVHSSAVGEVHLDRGVAVLLVVSSDRQVDRASAISRDDLDLIVVREVEEHAQRLAVRRRRAVDEDAERARLVATCEGLLLVVAVEPRRLDPRNHALPCARSAA